MRSPPSAPAPRPLPLPARLAMRAGRPQVMTTDGALPLSASEAARRHRPRRSRSWSMIAAVLPSMIVAEQYFSCDSAIARSTAAAGKPHAADDEVQVDPGEHLRVLRRALRRHLDAAAAHVVTAALEDQDDVVGAAGAGAGEHRLHRPRREIAAAAVGRAVHRQQVAAAGLGARTPCRWPASQSIVHSISAAPSRDIAAATKKTPTLVFKSVRDRRSVQAPVRVEPIVSSTSSIGGFSPGQQCLGLFSRPLRGREVRQRARMMRRRNRQPLGDTQGMAKSLRKPAPKKRLRPQAGARRLPAEDPDGARLRRRDRVGARRRAALSARLGNQVLLQARGHAAGVQLQAARRLQQDGAPLDGGAGARRDLRLGGQPCAGRRARRARARLQGAGRHADDHALAQGRGGARPRRRGRAARRQLLRRLRPRARARGASAASPSCIRSTIPT